MKRAPVQLDFDDTVSEMSLGGLLPPDVPELTPVTPGLDEPTQRQVLRIQQPPELTPQTLERRHPRYGGQLLDAVLSEVTEVPDRDQALDELAAQRGRTRASEGELTAELEQLLRHRGHGHENRRASDSSSTGARAAVSARAHRGRQSSTPAALDAAQSTFMTSAIVGMALVIVGATTALLALPLLPSSIVSRLMPAVEIKLASPADPPPAVADASATRGPPSKSIAELAADGDAAAMARLAQKPPSELSATEIVALSRGQLERRRAELRRVAEALHNKQREPDSALLRQVFSSARDPAVAEDALLVLARWPTPQGSDALWELSTRRQTDERVRALARDLLLGKEAPARLSPALAVAVDLSRITSADEGSGRCGAAAEVVSRARQHADLRALTLLGSLEARRGCGPGKGADCYPCLRRTPALGQAIKAAARRPTPAID